nr:unnamed protein product [Callosobruchus analis]
MGQQATLNTVVLSDPQITKDHITLTLKDQEFLQSLVEKVAASVTKSLEGKLAELEKIILNNSTVIKELKEEAAMLQMENKVLTQKLDQFDQVGRLGNLRIFQLEEVVATTIESRLDRKMDRPLSDKELLEIIENESDNVEGLNDEQDIDKEDRRSACESICTFGDQSDQEEENELEISDHDSDSEQEWEPPNNGEESDS